MTDYDILIVGGGVMGSSIAYHLRRADPAASVAVVERDSTYQRASTVLSDGNVRVQFNLEENILISQHTLEVLETFATDMATSTYQPDPGVKRQGNLFTVTRDSEPWAIKGLETQVALGCRVEWLDGQEISNRFPRYENAGLVGGTLGHDDGSVDPTAVLRGYRSKAIELGAVFIESEVAALSMEANGVAGASTTSGESISARQVLVAAGAWSTGLLEDAGITIPVLPYMRTVYVVSTPFEVTGLPSIFLPNGVYLIGESENMWLMGLSQPDDPIGFDFTPASRERFEERIWPGLVDHLPQFDKLTIERSWAGLYAVNGLDHNAIIGRWPSTENLYLATGFSGHGFQQAPAVGRYLAELLLDQPHVLDLSRLGPQRIVDNRPLHEHPGRVI